MARVRGQVSVWVAAQYKSTHNCLPGRATAAELACSMLQCTAVRAACLPIVTTAAALTRCREPAIEAANAAIKQNQDRIGKVKVTAFDDLAPSPSSTAPDSYEVLVFPAGQRLPVACCRLCLDSAFGAAACQGSLAVYRLRSTWPRLGDMGRVFNIAPNSRWKHQAGCMF